MPGSRACMKSLSPSETKRMTTLQTTSDGVVAYAKGAPEVILDSCASQLMADGEWRLDAAGRMQILDAARYMASEALRVQGFLIKKGLDFRVIGRTSDSFVQKLCRYRARPEPPP